MQDFGISIFYLRRLKNSAALENALFFGHGNLPNYQQAELETIIAGRQLLLANDLLTNETADLQANVPRDFRTTLTHLPRDWDFPTSNLVKYAHVVF